MLEVLLHKCRLDLYSYVTFINGFGIRFKFTKYTKELIRLSFDPHFSFQYFMNISWSKIFPINDSLEHYGRMQMNWPFNTQKGQNSTDDLGNIIFLKAFSGKHLMEKC